MPEDQDYPKKRVVIVGGVAGGASTAARLRRLDEYVEIIMLEKGPYVSFANCGLPYYVGNVIKDRSALELMTPELFNQRFNFDVRVNNEVVMINSEKKELSVIDKKTNQNYQLSYDVLVLSPGAAPIIPPLEGLKQIPYFKVQNIPDIESINNHLQKNSVEHATVIGAGYIGIEMVENLSERGIQVDLIELAPQVLMPFDFEMAQIVHQELGFNGIKLHLGRKAVKFEQSNGKSVVILDNGVKINTQMVILAVGVRPETQIAREAGLKMSQSGHIIVDSSMRTSNTSIYAVGDAILVHNLITNEPQSIQLAGIANRQGRIAAENIAGILSEFTGALGTSIVKVFGLTAAATGINERTAKSKNMSYEKVYAHPNHHAGYYPGAIALSIKLLFDPKSGKILGAQAIGGEGVDKRIDVIATTMKLGGNVFDLEHLELAYAPPYGSAKDPINMIGFIASNVIRGQMKIWQWHDLDKIKQENGIIIDTRTKEEYDTAHIEGAINISDLELRKRINEIPKDRPIYLHCQVGFRGYLAYRTLSQLGYKNVANLTGGFKTYEYAKMLPEDFAPLPVNPKAKIIEQTLGRPADDISGQKELKIIDACGLSCPGPLNSLIQGLKDVENDRFVQIKATDPGFISSLKAYVQLNEGLELISMKKEGSTLISTLLKTKEYTPTPQPIETAVTENTAMQKSIKIPRPIRPTGIPAVSEINAPDLHMKLKEGEKPAIIIDVREKQEWNHGHLKEAVLIPLGKLQENIKKLEDYKEKEIITVCHSGARSYMAAQLLERAGFQFIRSLRGGMVAWARSGYEYVQ